MINLINKNRRLEQENKDLKRDVMLLKNRLYELKKMINEKNT